MPNSERTFILGNSQAIEELEGTFIKVPDLINEVEIHNWILAQFRDIEVEKVVIEMGENPLLSLQMGYHLRLSIEDLQEKTLVSILFISALSLNAIMLQTGLYSQILATKGVFFSELNLQSNKSEIQHMNGLSKSEYLTNFLKIIHVQPDETFGRHSLANTWGAYAMDRASNANALSPDSDFKKSLYFKYVSAFNNIGKLKSSSIKVLGNMHVGTVNKISSVDKKVLLIDDEADKGWETVLKKVFKNDKADDFVVIGEKVKDFDSFSDESKRVIETGGFDLYLVDLRLNGLEEEETLKTDEFSGMKVLRKIKSINQGNQVIIFTASNKVWNLKALLDAGADGYYMKESPEYNFSGIISEQNYKGFKENVAQSFRRGYLREVWSHWIDAKNEKSNPNPNFIAESNTALDIAWKLISSDYLDFGFLTLFQSIESYANSVFQFDSSSGKYKVNGTNVIKHKNDNENEWFLTYKKNPKKGDYFTVGRQVQSKKIKPTTLYKISCLFHLKYKKENAFLKDVGKLNKLRNEIAHHGATGRATKKDLIDLLEIIKETRT